MRALLLLLFSIHVLIGFAQPKVGYWLDSEVIRIPFELINQNIFVKVDLNDHRKLSFLVDTGSSYSVVFTDSVIKVPSRLTLTSLHGFGKLDSIPVAVSVYNTLKMGGLTSYGQQILAIEKDKVGFQQFFDRPLHGIIGLDVLKNFDIEINFSSGRMILSKQGLELKKNKKWINIPLIPHKNSILIPARISNTQQKLDSIYLVIDTGSQLPLILNERFCPISAFKTIIGLGFLGYATGRIGKLDKLQVEKLQMNEMVTAFPDSQSARWNPELPQSGNLGIQFLQQYRIRISYSNNIIQLKPINAALNPEYNRCGMAVAAQTGKGCSYFIEEIVKGSPADLSGLKKGDKIMAINEKKCADLSLEVINNYLFGELGLLKILIKRDEEAMLAIVYPSNN